MAASEGMITITSSDGFSFEGFVARAEGQSKGGLIILQEIFGVTDQLKSVARSYADDGFDAIVPAFFDRKSPQTVVPFDQAEKGRDLAMSLDPGEVLLDAEAAKGAVDSGNGVSVIGFCWGGGQALRLACNLSFKSAIALYGTALKIHLGNCPDGPKCPMYFHFGETDDHSPPDVIDAVREALPDAKIDIYAAGHAFANDARPTVYDEEAANTARERTLAYLNQIHGA